MRSKQLQDSIVRVMRKNAETIRHTDTDAQHAAFREVTPQEEKRRQEVRLSLTKEDWVEIYYALEYKLSSRVVQGRDRESRAWRSHLKRIIETIGPDGIFMR